MISLKFIVGTVKGETILEEAGVANKRKRARTKKGRYKGDDKSTPFWNEAWVKGRSPKGKSPLKKFLDWFLK